MNKIVEIKEALAAATPGPWNKEGVEIWRRGESYGPTTDAHVFIADVVNAGNRHLITHAPEYITYLLQEIERKDETTRKAINIWETATPEDDFDDIMHAVIDTLREAL